MKVSETEPSKIQLVTEIILKLFWIKRESLKASYKSYD